MRHLIDTEWWIIFLVTAIVLIVAAVTLFNLVLRKKKIDFKPPLTSEEMSFIDSELKEVHTPGSAEDFERGIRQGDYIHLTEAEQELMKQYYNSMPKQDL